MEGIAVPEGIEGSADPDGDTELVRDDEDEGVTERDVEIVRDVVPDTVCDLD